MASLRYRIWDRCTRRIPEATVMPLWAVALNVALFPVRAMGALIYRRTYPFDIWTQTWNIHGARFSDRVLMVMAGNIDEGWYKFSRASDGIVIVERRMKDPSQAAQKPEPMIPDCYRGNDIRVYREGFHAGYEYAAQAAQKQEVSE